MSISKMVAAIAASELSTKVKNIDTSSTTCDTSYHILPKLSLDRELI